MSRFRFVILSVWLGGFAVTVAAQNIGNVDPAGVLRQDHLKRIEQAAPSTPVLPAPKAAAPEPAAPASAAVVLISEIQFSKSELLSDADLQAVAKPYVGRQLSAADIQHLLDDVTKLYQSKGILTGVPVLPQQDLQTGVMRILLVEGRFGEVKVPHADTANADWVKRWFDLQANTVLKQEELRQRVVRFNYASDYSATAEMVAGPQFGQTDLSVEVAKTKQLQGWGFYDTSTASRPASLSQLGVGLRVIPLTAYGGRLDMSTVSTDIGSTLSAATSLPLGTDGWRTGLSGSSARSATKVAGSSADLNIKGESSSMSWDVSRTWVLDEPLVMVTALSLGQNRSKTKVDDTTLLDRQANTLSLLGTWYYDSPNQRGYLRTNYSIGAENAAYSYLEFTGIWRSALDDSAMWFFRTGGLGRFKPDGILSTLDLFYLGGYDTVRGFDLGAANGDHGLSTQWEIRRSLKDFAWETTEAYAFVDWGQTLDAITQAPHTLSSTGFGVQAKFRDQLGVEVMATQQLSAPTVSPTRLMLRLTLSL